MKFGDEICCVRSEYWVTFMLMPCLGLKFAGTLPNNWCQGGGVRDTAESYLKSEPRDHMVGIPSQVTAARFLKFWRVYYCRIGWQLDQFVVPGNGSKVKPSSRSEKEP